MKNGRFYLLLAFCLFLLGVTVFSQTPTVIYGNLGVENVNISVLNTPYGTSSDGKGYYALPVYDRSQQINLYYSCIGYLDTIVSEYHQVVAEEGGIDLINEGIWDGYLLSLAQNGSLIFQIHWYCAIAANKEYCILPLVFKDYLQFVDVDNHQIVEINKNFEVASRRPLTVTSGDKYFKNEFLKDEATGKAYGLFINDGVNYLGLYHPTEGIVGMGSKASKVSYPRVFRVNDGYAYSVFYDSSRIQGVINRVRINN